jgi:hypothetical protein
MDDTTPYQAEGSMLHRQVERFVQNKPFNEPLDAEQTTAIVDAAEFLFQLDQKFKFAEVYYEQEVTLARWGIEECSGTADIITEAVKPRSLHVLDWKFGKGVFVPVEKNEQLMTYLLGALQAEQNLDDYDELWIHIAQPRLENYASYKCTKDELLGLVNAIKNAQKSHRIEAGEKQCFWCRGKNRCSEYEVMVRGKAALVFQVNDLMKQNEYPFEKMAKVLLLESDFKKIFKAIKDSLQELNNEQLKVLKLKRVAGRSIRQWASAEATARFLMDKYEAEPESITTTPELKSPAQIEKEFKGIAKDMEYQALIVKPVGAPVLASISDPRPEYQQDASSVFQKYLEK